MCGIVGVASCKNLDSIDLKVFRQLLYIDTIRGVDSTGIAAINHEGSVKVVKRAIAGPDFLDMKQVDKAIDALGNRAIIGHNRAATKGSINNRMAHPFQFGTITGVHNGTLWVHRGLGGGNDFTSDSEAIMWALSRNSVEDVAKQMDGAFALVWHDSSDNSLNFLRNNDRPLSIGINKKAGCMAWASEQMMLTWIAGRNKLGLEVVQSLPVGMHWKFKLDELPEDKVETKIDLRDASKWYEKEDNSYYSQWGNNRYANNSYYNNKSLIRMKVTECLPALGLKNKYDIFGVTESGEKTIIKDNNYTVNEGQIISSRKDYDMRINGEPFIRCTSSTITHLGRNAEWNPKNTDVGASDGSADGDMDDVYAGENCEVCRKRLTWAELDDCEWDTAGNAYCKECKVITWPADYDENGNPIPDDDDDDDVTQEIHAYFDSSGIRDSTFTDSNGRTWNWDADSGTWVGDQGQILLEHKA